jgi:acetyltransferase
MQVTDGRGADLARDVFLTERRPLDALFAPRNVALIGATEGAGSVGRTILKNLVGNPFGGVVYPVNPRRNGVLGIRAYPRIADVPDRVDLAVIVTPAATVPGLIGECVEAGVKGAIVISAGFKETGPEGLALERQVLEAARKGRMRIVGPNCLGLMNTRSGLNATFAGAMARPGSVGFVSQSGALCTAVLDWSFRENVGFSAFVSIGSMLDVDWGDLIDHLGSDPHTKAIVLYMESIGDARSFLSAAREVALTKPIIVIKAGRSEAAAKAAASHTGALAGSDEVLDAAFRRCGVVRVNRIDELFSMAEVLGKQPRPRGPKLTVLTNAGGPGVLATDTLIAAGGELAAITPETIQKLGTVLPAHWSHGNPIDVLGDAGPERYAAALEVAARDPNSDGLLVILTPQAMTDPTGTAAALAPFAHGTGKPILASWMGGEAIAEGELVLNRAGIPTFAFPDIAAQTFSYMWRYTYNLRGLYETPTIAAGPAGDAQVPPRAGQILATARAGARTLLTEHESKELLAAYGIPTVPTRVAATADAAAEAAEALGYPIVLKLHSETITHKTDVGGVLLNLADAQAVRAGFARVERSVRERAGEGHFLGVTVQPMVKLHDAYELIVGSSLDPQFGPVLLFGAGGQLVEVMRDRALALPPLNTTLARRMMEQTRIHAALKGVRGRPPVKLEALEQLLVQFGRLVVEQRWVREIDINPLLVSHEGLIALDARVVLHPPELPESQLPTPAIRPYPTQYASFYTLADGSAVYIRPIRPEDEPKIVRFHHTLSEGSVRLRYFTPMKLSQRVSHERLTRICFIDYDREMALVVEGEPSEPDGPREILGIGRLSKRHGTEEAEFALLVSDRHQRKGLGAELLRRLLLIARGEQLRRVTADVLTENTGMLRLCQHFGFAVDRTDDPTLMHAAIDLK